eukprot:357267-Chlamydomonas_euryale.AAC.3
MSNQKPAACYTGFSGHTGFPPPPHTHKAKPRVASLATAQDSGFPRRTPGGRQPPQKRAARASTPAAPATCRALRAVDAQSLPPECLHARAVATRAAAIADKAHSVRAAFEHVSGDHAAAAHAHCVALVVKFGAVAQQEGVQRLAEVKDVAASLHIAQE